MKKISRRSFLMATGAVAMAGALAACGAETASTDTTSSTVSSAADASSADAAPADVALSFGWWGGDARHAYTEEICNIYAAENEGVTFDLQPGSWSSYWEKIVIQAAGGTMPSVLQMDYGYIVTYANNETLYDMSTFIDDGTIDVSKMDPNLLSTGEVDGKLVGIPVSQSARAMIFNQNALDEAGLEAPATDWTWADFIAMCKTYSEKTGNYAMSDYANATELVQYMVRQEYEDMYLPDGTGLAVEAEAFIPFFQLHADLRDAKAICSPDEYVTIRDLPVDQSLIATDKALFLYNSNTYAAMSNDHCFLCLSPYSESGKNTAWARPGMFYSIAATADEATARASAEFINWILSSTDVADLQGVDRGIPSSGEICDYLLANPDIKPQDQDTFDYFALLTEFGGACPPPEPAALAEVKDEMERCIEALLDGQYDVEAAAKDFYESATAVFARNN